MSFSTNFDNTCATGMNADVPEDHILRIQQNFGCSRKAAELAYYGFGLYIPHLWVGTKTRDDGTLKGEGLVYGVFRNLGLGFLTKTTEEKKAINIKLVPGRDGNKDHQSCLIKFDRLFTRGEENSGNIAILEHLLKDPVQSGGKTIHNHLKVEYQDAGPNRYTGKDEPARFWKVYLWRPQAEKAPAPAAAASPRSPRVRFSLVDATAAPSTNSAAGVVSSVSFAAAARGSRANAVSPPETPPPADDDGFQTVGDDGRVN